LTSALEAVAPVETTANLRGKRWSKLAINCAISSLGTLGGDRLGALLQHRFVRRLALEIMTEAVAVAKAEGVALEKVAGTLDLDWIALSEEDRAARGSAALTAKHMLLLAVGLRYRRMRSSMLAAIERGRTPAIDFLNGEVVARGGKHGVATPVNERIVKTVWAIAKSEIKSSRETLDAVCSAD
jgi:2-dehydropantoate 2-reductase